MSLHDLIEQFIEYLRNQKRYSLHTIRNYQIDLRQFSEFVALREERSEGENSDPGIGMIDSQVIRAYLGSLYGRFRRSTIARKLSAVRSFFLFLERKGLTKWNPAADIATPKLEKYYAHLSSCG